MNYIINQSKLKSIIKDRFNIDLTGRIELDPNVYKILNDFDNHFTYEGLKRRLSMENYGPMYLIELNDRIKILYQMNYSSNSPLIISNQGDIYDESDFMNFLGIRPLGLTLEQFIDLYI